ncbi:MAG: hypothetical protein Q7S58_00785 [Candidatus Binatus sp.]|uniref:hypothetical protein n=1 Tax=Candidatus Binatus sp. TaxID=2811406 RepID=UPI0027265BF6|nr:hypothetical protein [Candidatus Binatus sp.]MDO8430922.1 hypothetical protein [Candidatus Binatus sp.]
MGREFSLKFNSFTITPGPAGSVLTQGNCEGTASGFGTVLGTATFVGGKSGSFSWCSQAFLDSGDQIAGTGSGTYESTGKHHWRTLGFHQNSDGGALISEGEIDLAKRSWAGKLFENS